jgi:hypothetical protein
MNDGDLIAWIPGLVYRNGYSVQWREGQNAERIEAYFRSRAEVLWGDAPRTEEIFEFDADHGRTHCKRVTWKTK